MVPILKVFGEEIAAAAGVAVETDHRNSISAADGARDGDPAKVADAIGQFDGMAPVR